MFKKFKEKFKTKVLQSLPDAQVMIEANARRGTSLSDKLNYNSIYRNAQNLNKWKNAVAAASDPHTPSKTALAELYDNFLLDNHLRSVIDSRILHVQRSAFKLIDADGIENKEVTELITKPWMEELIKLIVMSKFTGVTLIEIYDLNNKGELKNINPIPMEHFNAERGIITREPDDESGWEYNEPQFKNYYLQIGKNNDLGMLERLGPIVLAKKLALGAYLDYVEKYGVPPLFITTDREDAGRLDQLIEAAENFKSNAFMVGRGQEKFEIGNPPSGSTDPFIPLMDYANQEISKAILGGSALVDEKSYVGSVDQQYKLAKDRFESDKLLFKYIFNEEVIPRLINLSPVYQPLESYTFEWDNTESLDIKDIIDAIDKIGRVVEIDPEYIEEITGIRVLGPKIQTSPKFDED